jgi:hypothetical protein
LTRLAIITRRVSSSEKAGGQRKRRVCDKEKEERDENENERARLVVVLSKMMSSS